MNTTESMEKKAPGARRINARAAGIVGLAVLCSRVLGLAREVLLAHLFGAGLAMDVFRQAFKIPNLLRDLFAEGALSTAFVTTFSKKTVTSGDASAWALANKVATLATVVLSAVVLIAVGTAPWFTKVIAGQFPPEKAALTVFHAQVMFPFILLVSLSALVMGMLNAKDVFGVPAMASSFFNIGSIGAGLGLAWLLDPSFGPKAILGLSCGTLIGGTAQLAVQLPALRRVGFRFRFDFGWRDEGVKQVLQLMGPAVIAASAVQVNVLVNVQFATYIEGNGPISWLELAFRLMQLPLGLFGVAIGTITLPLVSRHAAVGDREGFRQTLGSGLRLGLLLTVPSTLGLIFLADPIISTIYRHGEFTEHAARQTAAALRCYAVGLCAYSGIKLLAPAFYALNRRNTPMLVSFASIGVNLGLSYLFTGPLQMGHRGLALSTGGVALVNFLALYELMRREMGGLESAQLGRALGKILGAGVALSLVCIVGDWKVLSPLAQSSLMVRVLALGGIIAVAGGVFFAIARWLRVEEMDALMEVVQRKLRRRRGDATR